MRLKSLHTWPAPREENIKIDPQPEHCLVNDWHALKVGYIETDMRRGEAVFIKPSVARELYKLLKSEVGE